MKKVKTVDFVLYLAAFLLFTVGMAVYLAVGGQLYGIRARAFTVGLVCGSLAWVWITCHTALFFANPQIFNAYAISRGRICTGNEALTMFRNTVYYVIAVTAVNSLPVLCGLAVEVVYCEGAYGFELDTILWMYVAGAMHFLVLLFHYIGQRLDMYSHRVYMEYSTSNGNK